MKIVICGGGTAGWLTALFLTHIHSSNEYILIENSDIGPIGVGEGSTGTLRDVITNKVWNFGLQERDFVIKTQSIPKLGINFVDWGNKSYVSPIDGSSTAELYPDYATLLSIVEDKDPYVASRQGFRGALGKTFYKDIHSLSSQKGGAYHFDGVKVGEYLKEHCLYHQNNIKVVDDKIVSITSKNNIVSTITLENQIINDVDLVIDCLGIKSIFNNYIDKGWVDYSKHLPVNTAIVFRKQNNDFENTKPFTDAIGMDNGWLFRIPVGNRYGCGYIFSNDFCSVDDAEKELISKGYEIDNYRKINFTSGRVKHFWKGNVISLGLSSGFLEPLQATSLHTTLAHLNILCFQSLATTKENILSQANFYNQKAEKYFDDFMNFVNLHYQCGRKDNEFWKYMYYKSPTKYVKNLIKLCNSRLPTLHDYETYPFSAAALWNSTIHGLKLVSRNTAKKQLEYFYTYNNKDNIQNEFLNHQNYFTNLDKPVLMADFMNHYYR